MCQVVADGSEGSVFVFPVLGEVCLASGGGGHAIENCGGYGFQFCRLCADHVDRHSGRLSKFRDVLRRDHAGIVGAIREHHYNFPPCILSRVFQRQQQRVVESCLISSYRRAHSPQHLRPVGSEGGGARDIPAIRIKGDLVGGSQRANKLANRILCEDKAAVHVVTGIKQNEHICAAYQRREVLSRGSVRRAYRQVTSGSGGRVLFGKIAETAGWPISFCEGGGLLHNSILDDGKILGTESGNVFPLLVRDRYIELDHVDHNVKVRTLLSFDVSFVAQHEPHRDKNQQEQSSDHEFKTPASATQCAAAFSARAFTSKRTSRLKRANLGRRSQLAGAKLRSRFMHCPEER